MTADAKLLLMLVDVIHFSDASISSLMNLNSSPCSLWPYQGVSVYYVQIMSFKLWLSDFELWGPITSIFLKDKLNSSFPFFFLKNLLFCLQIFSSHFDVMPNPSLLNSLTPAVVSFHSRKKYHSRAQICSRFEVSRFSFLWVPSDMVQIISKVLQLGCWFSWNRDDNLPTDWEMRHNTVQCRFKFAQDCCSILKRIYAGAQANWNY